MPWPKLRFGQTSLASMYRDEEWLAKMMQGSVSDPRYTAKVLWGWKWIVTYCLLNFIDILWSDCDNCDQLLIDYTWPLCDIDYLRRWTHGKPMIGFQTIRDGSSPRSASKHWVWRLTTCRNFPKIGMYTWMLVLCCFVFSFNLYMLHCCFLVGSLPARKQPCNISS